MRVKIFAFGKLKASGARDFADHYKNFLSQWVDFEEIELKPLSVSDKSPAVRSLIQNQEGKILLGRIQGTSASKSPFFLLDESGKAMPTRDWALKIKDWENEGLKEVSFCIGSSLGFSATVRTQARGVFSFGPQTFSHELARVVLIEQLFRAWSVVKGHPYHNEG